MVNRHEAELCERPRTALTASSTPQLPFYYSSAGIIYNRSLGQVADKHPCPSPLPFPYKILVLPAAARE